jgi:hypothetical protein
MAITVCLSVSTFDYPQGGGHRWVYLNWALGLHANGCRVIWLESVSPKALLERSFANLEALQRDLEPFGLGGSVALCSTTDQPLPAALTSGCLDLEAAIAADLLLNLRYGTHPGIVRRFRRRALIDIDPGLLQVWLSQGKIAIPPHDVYFSIGETVGRPDACFPDGGLSWQYAPPCVALDAWPMHAASHDPAFTTVSHWNMGEGMYDVDGVEAYANDKRIGFLPFLDLPRDAPCRLELALCLAPEENAERAMLRARGWSVVEAWEVTATPRAYRTYIQRSRGEFSCVKPSCIRLQNAWVSDRSLCYLASGKPVVVQHTGPSRILPDAEGILRFRDPEEALAMLRAAEARYDHHCRAGRALVEEHFDATKVVARVLAQAVG